MHYLYCVIVICSTCHMHMGFHFKQHGGRYYVSLITMLQIPLGVYLYVCMSPLISNLYFWQDKNIVVWWVGV